MFLTHCSIKFIVFTYDFLEAWSIVLLLPRPSVYDVPYHQAGLIKEIEEINENNVVQYQKLSGFDFGNIHK